MQHPINELGEKRVCPETGKQFRECWTNRLKGNPPFAYNECDQCSPGGKTIAGMLKDLNDKAAREQSK